jgi:two-component system cell cycle sensor histidine kinase/response regulator CckA
MNAIRVIVLSDPDRDVTWLGPLLREAGYDPVIQAVSNAADLCSALPAEPRPEAIVSAVSGTSFSAAEVFRLVRQKGFAHPFVVVSGSADEDTAAAKTLIAGVTDFVKSSHRGSLVPAIERGLAQTGLVREQLNAVLLLKEAEERYRIVAETASDTIITIDDRGTIVYANRAAETTFGHTRDELLNSPVTILIPNFLQSAHSDALAKYVETGVRKLDWNRIEVVAQHKDGHLLQVELSFGEFVGGDQRRFTALIRDQSAPKAAQIALERSEEYFRALVEATTQFVWKLDAKANLVEFPHWWEELTGQPYEESLKYGWVACVHPDDQDFVQERYKWALANGEPISLTLRLRTKEGGYNHYEGRGVPIKGADGSIVQWICALVDITDKNRAELELRRSEANFRALVQATTQFVWTADESGFSHELFDWFAEKRGVPVNSVEDLVELMHPVDEREARQEWQESLDQRKVFQYVCRFYRGDGTMYYLAARAVPMYNADGEFDHWIGTFTDITERMVEQQALQQSEERFRDLFENANDLIYTHDLEGNFTSLNRAGEIITGYTRSESEKLNIRDVVDPEFLAIAAEKIAAKVDGRAPATSYETAIITKDGRRVLLDLSTRLIYKNDKPAGVQGIARDITEKKEAEIAVRSSEKQLRIIADSIPVHITHIGVDDTIRFANAAFLRWLGKTPEEVFGKHAREVLGNGPFDRIRPEFERVIAGEAFSVEREVFLDPAESANETSKRFVRMDYVPEFDDDGKVRAFFAFMTDLTENKRSERLLRKSEEQLQIVTDTVPVVIAYLDNDLICRFVNRSYLDSIGKTADQVLGQPLLSIQGQRSFDVVNEEIKLVRAGVQSTFERGPSIRPLNFEDGRGTFFRVNYVMDRGPSDEILGYFVFAIDLTENKRAEDALRKSEEQLRQSQKLESVGRLAGGIAHDFNNMLTAINGYSELTLRRMHASDPLRHNIEEIRKAGERSAELTNQLLAFSRRQILQPRVMELSRAVGDLIPMLERLIGADISLRADFAATGGFVNADPGQLSQVLLNLVINSRDAMPDGGSIDISTRRVVIESDQAAAGSILKAGTYAVLSITDTGLGMEPEMVKHIFEPFFTTKDVGKGTGLGLSTVYGIVHQSGGNIIVKSIPGSGSTFEIYLPNVAADEDTSEGAAAKETGRFAFGSETILLVEDEETVRDLGREILESCGYSVITAGDGVQGLDMLRKRGSDIGLLLTDVVMPRMGGRELAEEAQRSMPHLKILFSSGYDDQSIVTDGALIEGTNFIQKPFSFDSLALKVREILDA